MAEQQKVKAVVTHSLFTDEDGIRYYRGDEVEVSKEIFDRHSKLDPPGLAKAGSDEAKAASAEVGPRTAAGLADPVKAANPSASVTDAPGLKGDVLRSEAGVVADEPIPDEK
jgi:hypothetical protein